ncbi:MAG: GLPGLI family protein [Dysgonamonadaceae bacterium]|nr:GLPGLI family protein [Dysgonamonadaceae bacterium]
MNITKFISISLLLASFSVFSGHSQEKAKYKSAYQFDYLCDTIKMEYFRPETYIVQIGDNITKGFTYQKFYLDSLMTHNPKLHSELFKISVKESIETMRKTGDISHVRNNSFTYGSFASDLYKDYKKNEIYVRDNISTYSFLYKDELKPQDWEILSDTATILGYACQKAQCHYRGRDWEAWFTTEIPISEGPWKFYGLPGLITKLHDRKKHYSFELIGFQEVNETIETKISKNIQKIDRKDFLRAKMGDKANQITQADLAKLGINSSGSSQRQYDYIELDYK